MPDWVQCPQCGLRHQVRENGLCPKCQNAVSASPEVASPPVAAPAMPEKAEKPEPPLVTQGQRIAGVVLIVNAFFAIVEAVMSKGAPDGGAPPMAGVVVDAYIGYTMAVGKPKAHALGLVRIGLGAVIWGGLALLRGDYAQLAVQLVFSGSLAMLIAGDASKVRVAAGAGLAGLCLLLEALGLAILAGHNPVSDAVARGQGNTPAAGLVRGSSFDYCVDVPNGWYLRGAEQTKAGNPLADRWLTRPDADAHVMIMVEQLSGPVDQQRLEKALEDDARSRLSQFNLLPREALPRGGALHYTGDAKSVHLEYLRGAVADGNRAFQLVAFSTPAGFAKTKAELKSMLDSFQPHCAAAR
jgi:hypothetical protein